MNDIQKVRLKTLIKRRSFYCYHKIPASGGYFRSERTIKFPQSPVFKMLDNSIEERFGTIFNRRIYISDLPSG